MQEPITKIENLSYNEAKDILQTKIWNGLDQISLRTALGAFITELKKNPTTTAQTYEYAFLRLVKQRLLNLDWNLKEMSLMNMEQLLDLITTSSSSRIDAKKLECAAFQSLLHWLGRQSGGLFNKAKTQKGITFKKTRSKAETEALSRHEWEEFIQALKGEHYREYLVALMTLQGMKRISEVLNVKIKDIDFSNNQIKFKKLKYQAESFTIVTYPSWFMDLLKKYTEGVEEERHIFITRNGTPLNRMKIWECFANLSKRRGFSKIITPHVLRATAITWSFEYGCSADQIARVSGHASCDMTMYYDKREISENITRRINFI